MKRIDAYLSKWYGTSEKTLLKVDLGIFGILVLVHGGSMLIGALSEDAATAPVSTEWLGTASVVVALVCLLAGLLALFRTSWTRQVLMLHSVVLLAYGAWFFWMAIEVAIHGIPPARRFSWNPFLFAFLVTYPPFLWLKLQPALRERRPAAGRIPLVVLVLSLVVSGIVLWRLYQQQAATMAEFGL
jgi:hypothetical protein